MIGKRIWIPAMLIGGIFLGGAGVAATGGGALGGRLAQTRLGRLVMARLGRVITLKAELNLTDAQKTAIKETLVAHKTELAGAIERVVARRRVLRDAVLADKPDEKAIRGAADDLGKALGDAAVTISKVKVDVKEKAGLTAEQMKLITDFRAQNDADVDKLFKE